MRNLLRLPLFLRVALSCLAASSVSCGPSSHRFHDASFTLPSSWDRTVSPFPKAFAATNATRDGYDLFTVIYQPHRADPSAMSASQFNKMADSIGNEILQMLRSNPSFTNVRERSRGTGKLGGIPVMEQVVGAHMRWPDGQSGDVVLNTRIYAAREAVYNFSLRESPASHRKDPGYFKRLMDSVRIE